MPALSIARDLSDGFPSRGAGTDAERRAAGWLSEQVSGPRRESRAETFWCRPGWALAHAWHCLVGAIGSLIAVSHPLAGAIVLAVVLFSVAVDGLAGISLGRRLTPERASQNIVSEPRAPRDQPVRLLVTANLDAGRTGLARRDRLLAVGARLRRLPAGRPLPGALGWLVIALAWLIAVALVRRGGTGGTAIGILQLVPTAGLVLALALLLDVAASPFGPAASDNAAGVGVAVALVRALDAAPPRHLRVELCLQGAGDAQMIGLRRHLRTRRDGFGRSDTVVLGIGAAGAGDPVWWESDGALVPLGFHRRLRELAAEAARAASHGGDGGDGGNGGNGGNGVDGGPLARPYRGRATSPALPARLRGLPALSIGCRDRRGMVPNAHSAADLAGALDPAAADRLLEFALMLVDAIDADLGRRADDGGQRGSARPAVRPS